MIREVGARLVPTAATLYKYILVHFISLLFFVINNSTMLVKWAAYKIVMHRSNADNKINVFMIEKLFCIF